MTSSLTSTGLGAQTDEERKEREIEQVRSMVSSLKERNGRLLRLNQALSIELKDIIAERVLLEGNYFFVLKLVIKNQNKLKLKKLKFFKNQFRS